MGAPVSLVIPTKSVSSDTAAKLLTGRSQKYTSLTLAGLQRISDEIAGYDGHIIIDDLGAEKSEWSRIQTAK